MHDSHSELHVTLTHIVRLLVDRPDEVRVVAIDTEAIDTESLRYQIHVDPLDLGKIIGKQGRTARAIRILVSAHGQKIKRRVSIDIAEAGHVA